MVSVVSKERSMMAQLKRTAQSIGGVMQPDNHIK